MTPREVIAKAIYDADYIAPDSEDFKVYYFKMADAVIDALEKMPVTVGMEDMACAWAETSDDTEVLWRGLVGAMRDE